MNGQIKHIVRNGRGYSYSFAALRRRFASQGEIRHFGGSRRSRWPLSCTPHRQRVWPVNAGPPQSRRRMGHRFYKSAIAIAGERVRQTARSEASIHGDGPDPEHPTQLSVRFDYETLMATTVTAATRFRIRLRTRTQSRVRYGALTCSANKERKLAITVHIEATAQRLVHALTM